MLQLPYENLIGHSSAKVGRKEIFKPTIWNENLHEISNDNGIRVVILATTKSLKSTMLSHRNIRKFTWTSLDGKTHTIKLTIF
jgi:hypothetical protein